jgi:HEAT repeat protein
MPEESSVPALISIAGSSKDLEVRKRAVSSLGQSKDSRAIQFLQDLVKRL